MQSPPLGYYRLGFADHAQVFAKVMRQEDAQVSWHAAHLADRAAQARIPAPRLAGPVIALDAEHCLIAQEWLPARFADGQPMQMRSLGTQLARLHAFLREDLPPSSGLGAHLQWQSSWQRMETLAVRALLPSAQAEALERLLRRRAWVQETLLSQDEPLHNDLHPGNILFTPTGHVRAFLDFEEALNARGNAWLDLAWVIERFCMIGPRPTRGASLARTFLDAYFGHGRGRLSRLPLLQDALMWKNFHALGLLQEIDAHRGAEGAREWRKFCWLVAHAQTRRDWLRSCLQA